MHSTPWNIPAYLQIREEIDPFTELERFRSITTGYDGNNDFWKTPSPEPRLTPELIELLRSPDVVSEQIGCAAQKLAASVADQYEPSETVFVAILRAGVPIADWLTRLLPGSLAVCCSLFVGVGIDQAALTSIKADHPDRRIVFVDGWTGKGGVAGELQRLGAGPLAVLVDPWGLADFCGSQEDLFCPSALFTGPTTLGFSRTFTQGPVEVFGAYRFPDHYIESAVVANWRQSCPPPASVSLSAQSAQCSLDDATIMRMSKTKLRVHSNEVCRALINSNPGELLFRDSSLKAHRDYGLLIRLAESRSIPMHFDQSVLEALCTNVACSLELH